MASYNPLSESSTSYNPRHSRALSDVDRVEMAEIADEMTLLERDKHLTSTYDPSTRSGRPSLDAHHTHHSSRSHSVPPRISLTSPSPSPHPFERLRSTHPHPPRSHSTWPKTLARIRLTLLLILLTLSAVIIGTSAHIYATYRRTRDNGKWVLQTNTSGAADRDWVSAWPRAGIDERALKAYLALGVLSFVLAGVFVIASVSRGFRYLSSAWAGLLVVLLVGGLSACWTLVSVVLQFEARLDGGKHSFRTWSCSHTDRDLYGGVGVPWGVLCAEAVSLLSLSLFLAASFTGVAWGMVYGCAN